MALLRGVVVTNHGTEHERVVLAVEAHPWHSTPEEAATCTSETCKNCHRIHVLDDMEFNFETRQVYPVGQPDWPGRKSSLMGRISPEDLKKFRADFGLYYSS